MFDTSAINASSNSSSNGVILWRFESFHRIHCYMYHKDHKGNTCVEKLSTLILRAMVYNVGTNVGD